MGSTRTEKFVDPLNKNVTLTLLMIQSADSPLMQSRKDSGLLTLDQLAFSII